ncbi:unnamed protein product [Pieris macdunnoughi]|uniref:Uncharacterized protein n=1 Tax=Pieris macdunnoughi TaxID=345717 RepID=A0A821TAH8_9NEOP|nr:unnamed protein product [Pieris macdunnoughi]
MGVRSCRTPSSSLDLNLRHARSPRDSNTTRRHALVYAGHRSCHKRSTLVYAEPASNIQAVGTSSMPVLFKLLQATTGCTTRTASRSSALSSCNCGVRLGSCDYCGFRLRLLRGASTSSCDGCFSKLR